MTPEQIRGGLLGLLVGDALGVPYEFHPPERIPAAEEIEMSPPRGFRRSHAHVPRGTWSDDGAHALCLLASLLHADRLDVGDLGRRLVNWLDHGYMAVDGDVFDVGIQTTRAIAALRAGAPAETAGPRGERDNGNGALMRVLPLALWHRGTDAALARDAMAQSLPTHGHRRSQLCCALYCLWARYVADGHDDAWGDAVASVRAIVSEGPDAAGDLAELEGPIDAMRAPGGTGTGYVVDCLHSARWACEADSFADVARRAIGLGRDTDTTAAVACGIAGLRDGEAGIPARWRAALREAEETVEPLLRKLAFHPR